MDTTLDRGGTLRTDVTVFVCDACGTNKKVCMLTAGLMTMWICAACLRRLAFYTDATVADDVPAPRATSCSCGPADLHVDCPTHGADARAVRA